MTFKVLVTTVPFGATNQLPLELLSSNSIEFVINPLSRKLVEDELIQMVGEFDGLIAGTEVISDRVMSAAPRLKFISRVGIGLDGVDLLAARKRGIAVSYTPDAPSPAVAELTIGLMINLLRGVHIADKKIHEGQWERLFGKRIADSTIGIIGVGRIGARVARRLSAFGSPRVLLNDLRVQPSPTQDLKVDWVDKETLLHDSDIVTLHVPLTSQTQGMIRYQELMSMKKGSCIINTSRGGIVAEDDLFRVLKEEHLGGAAIDVFEREPYTGPLSTVANCILTAHMGSMTRDCRERMEIEATEEMVRFSQGLDLTNSVPDFEYVYRSQGDLNC